MGRLRMSTRSKVPGRQLALAGFLLLFLPAWPAALAQESKIYVSQKHGFSFHYPATHELKVVAPDSYFDLKTVSGNLICLRVDDQFIPNLYLMLHPPPHMVMYFPRRGEEDPYRKLARETQENQKLFLERFHRYARNEAKNWCSADGPDGSVYCEEIKREKPFTSRNGLHCLELYPVMIREDYTNRRKAREVVGPILAVYLPRADLPLVLMISPPHGEPASPALIQEMQGIVDSLRVAP